MQSLTSIIKYIIPRNSLLARYTDIYKNIKSHHKEYISKGKAMELLDIFLQNKVYLCSITPEYIAEVTENLDTMLEYANNSEEFFDLNKQIVLSVHINLFQSALMKGKVFSLYHILAMLNNNMTSNMITHNIAIDYHEAMKPANHSINPNAIFFPCMAGARIIYQYYLLYDLLKLASEIHNEHNQYQTSEIITFNSSAIKQISPYFGLLLSDIVYSTVNNEMQNIIPEYAIRQEIETFGKMAEIMKNGYHKMPILSSEDEIDNILDLQNQKTKEIIHSIYNKFKTRNPYVMSHALEIIKKGVDTRAKFATEMCYQISKDKIAPSYNRNEEIHQKLTGELEYFSGKAASFHERTFNFR